MENIQLKTIQDTEHSYHLIETADQRQDLISTLSNHLISTSDICFDTETTGLDAIQCELVGMSFSIKEHEGYYIPLPADRDQTVSILNEFKSLFEHEAITWIGQNIKYDMLVLKNYGFELQGKLWDTMLAHYCFEPEGKRSMDLLSAQYLQYEPVHIEELIGKKGKDQLSMRDADLEKMKYAVDRTCPCVDLPRR